MNFNIFKKAFSLTELLIVLVIVGVLFAAMVPIITKRGSGASLGNEQIWMFVRNDDQGNAYFDPGSSSLTGTAYVGFNASALSSSEPLSKMLLRVNGQQAVVQFRTGNDGDGEYSGIFTVGESGKGNLISTTSLYQGVGAAGSPCEGFCLLDKNNIRSAGDPPPQANTVFGPHSASNVTWMTASTLAGANSGFGSGNPKEVNAITNIGKDSNRYLSAFNSTLVGANTGKNTAAVTHIDKTLAVGSGVLGMPDSKSKYNVYIGYNVAGLGFNGSNEYNVILNSQYYGKSPKNSVIVGTDSYRYGMESPDKLTAIGYNACVSFNPNNENSRKLTSPVTCIGYNSAGQARLTKKFGWNEDGFDHVFLGGVPMGFGGRSVLEVHNLGDAYAATGLEVLPKVAPTVVLNSNLVVRGNLYIPSVDTGEVQAIPGSGYSEVWAKPIGTMEQGQDYCRRNKHCLSRRKKFHKTECHWLEWIIIGLIVIASIATMGVGGYAIAAATVIAEAIAGTLAMGVGGFALYEAITYGGSNGDQRHIDPATASGIGYMYYADTKDGYKRKPFARCSPYQNDYYFTLGKEYKDYVNAPCPQPLLSDARLKENISENHIALSKLLMVQPYNYTYKMDKEAVPQVGVMAQDLEKFFPTSVFNNPDGYKKIRWDEMFFATVNSVKSLDDSVTKLEYDLVIMDDDTDKIANDMKNVKNRIKDIDNRIKRFENK